MDSFKTAGDLRNSILLFEPKLTSDEWLWLASLSPNEELDREEKIRLIVLLQEFKFHADEFREDRFNVLRSLTNEKRRDLILATMFRKTQNNIIDFIDVDSMLFQPLNNIISTRNGSLKNDIRSTNGFKKYSYFFR